MNRIDEKDGRDYHYRIPLFDEVAVTILHLKYHHSDRYIELNCCDDITFPYICCSTYDGAGHLDRLEQYVYSKQWESPFGPGKWSNLEIRYANGGGTKIRGEVWTTDRFGGEITVPVNTTIGMTVGEVKDALDGDSELMEELTTHLTHIEEDACREYREAKAAEREECSHEHVHEFREPKVNPEAPGKLRGFCEDCGEGIPVEDD